MPNPKPTIEERIEGLIKNDPTLDVRDLKPDPKFKASLLARLMHGQQPIASTNINPKFNFMKKINLFLAGATVVAIAALLIVTRPGEQSLLLPGTQEVTQIDDHAFGSLAQLTVSSPRGQGGGGGGGGVAQETAASPSSLIYPPGSGGGGGFVPTIYRFKYSGEAFTVDQPTMPVYMRQKGFGTINLSTFLDKFNVGLFDINKFASATMDYFRASENRDFGYAVNIDFKEGSIYIDQNWERWQTPDRLCLDEACSSQYRIEIDQIPADEQVITLANQFLDEYGISRSSYGTPFVQDFWRIEYARATDKSQIYLPDTITVVYPLIVAGHEIYDEGGMKTGLYVGVNIRVNKVSSVTNLNDQRFESSEYETEQDVARLIKIAEQGGQGGYIPMAEDANAQTEELSLGTPETGYVRTWFTKSNLTRELYVPALIFPVEEAPEGYYIRNVVVPLVKDVLDQPQYGGPINIMQ